MKCEDVNDLLAAYLDEEITPEERRQIEAHLETCEKCRDEMRLLASTQTGLRQAFDAMVARVEPSPQVWNRVRQRMESRNPLWEKAGAVLNKPLWRAAIPAVLVLIVIGALWGSGVIPGFQSGTTPIPATTPGLPPRPVLNLGIVSNKTVYSVGEPIIFEVSITNVSPAAIVFGPDPPTTQIKLPGRQARDVEIVATSAPGSGEVKLEPGEKVTYNVFWDQHDSQGQQVPPGPYFPNIEARDISIDGKAGPRIGGALGILIQPPLEPGERILEVNQSRNVEGNIFTLERIELKSTEMDIYASVKPVDSSVTIYVVSAEAEYCIDGGPLKEAGPSEILHNVLHIWKSLPPVPNNSRELTFIITRFGNMEGPWEFKVPLQ
jgi:hypothetical protein